MKKLIVPIIILMTLSACSQLGLSSTEPTESAEPVDLSGIESQLEALDKKIEEQSKKLDVIEAKLDKPVAKPKLEKPNPDLNDKNYGLSEGDPVVSGKALIINVANTIVENFSKTGTTQIKKTIYTSNLGNLIYFLGDTNVGYLQTPTAITVMEDFSNLSEIPKDVSVLYAANAKIDLPFLFPLNQLTQQNQPLILKFSHKMESENEEALFLYGITFDFEYEIVEVSK